MKSRLYSILKFAIGWPLSLLAFIFIGKIILEQAPLLMPHITALNPTLLFYGIVSFIIYYFLRSIIWHRILKDFGYKIAFRESNYLWAMSELKRYIPGNIWSFLGRAILFGKHKVDKKDVGKGLIYEAEIFVIGSIIVSLLSLPFLVPAFSKFIGWAAVIIVSFGVIAFIFTRKVFGFASTHKAAFLFPNFHPKEIALQITISTAALLFFGLGNYLVISSAVPLDPQLLPGLIGVFVLAFVAGYLSIVTPAGFGVREGIVIFGLTKLINYGLAAFAALFSRLILIISELIFIGISYVWVIFKSPALRKVETWIAAHPHEVVIFCLAGIYIIYFSTISMLRYDHFYAGRFDLGNMAQTVWNTSTGNIFMLTNPNDTNEVSRLAFHADFILIFLAPFYWLWPDPRMLLLIQTIVVAIGAYFVYLLTKHVLNHKLLGVVLAFAYLISPSVQRVTIYDFHAPALATTFLLGTFYFYIKKQYKWFFLFALLAAFCKEQIWAIIAVFGIFLMIHHKKWVMGSLVFLVSAGMFYFLVSYAIPQSLGDEHFALEYFSDFGSSPAEVIKTVILSPDKLLSIIMEDEHLKYLKQLFSPLGYLSYAAPWLLIFAGPDLLINLLSNNSQLHQIYYQYTAAITPFIFIAAIYGIWVLRQITKLIVSKNVKLTVNKRQALTSLAFSSLSIYILYSAIMGAFNYGPLPGSKDPNTTMMTIPEKNRELIDKTLAAIPPEKRVAASNNIGSHLSNRRDIYVLPLGAEKADVIVFLLTDSEHGSSFVPEQEQLKKFSADPRYKKVVQKDEFTVFERL
jgi:uncharacterized membrane protein/uncharacterized membrane protein YbhN (UPF0104 family)